MGAARQLHSLTPEGLLVLPLPLRPPVCPEFSSVPPGLHMALRAGGRPGPVIPLEARAASLPTSAAVKRTEK